MEADQESQPSPPLEGVLKASPIYGKEFPIKIFGFDPRTSTLRLSIGNDKVEVLQIHGQRFNPADLWMETGPFASIEHPIRDDIESDLSVIRTLLKQVLEPQGIRVRR